MTDSKDEKYMWRALELALHGEGFTSPNPMVGAVIVAPDDRIIGEGWHRRCGGPHAEVNAVASVRPEDKHLLPSSTIYVTLEPCSHYGKTPPCSKLLKENKLKRVVAGMSDPFKEVSGRGFKMLREAGIEVTEGVLEKECRELNKRFVTAHTLRRPYIQLKWAQSADGFIAEFDKNGKPCLTKLSNPLSLAEMHRERSLCDAILVGTNTVISDNPSLTTRLWSGNSPRPVIFESPNIPTGSKIFDRNPIILPRDIDLEAAIRLLYEKHGVTSLMVEGGTKILEKFINDGIYDEIRLEISSRSLGNGVKAPVLPHAFTLAENRKIRENTILKIL